MVEGSDEYSTPQNWQGDLVTGELVFSESYKRELMTILFQNTYQPELGECDEYSTPSSITAHAWSTCNGCGEGDEDSAPSSPFNPLAGISGRRERIAASPVRG